MIRTTLSKALRTSRSYEPVWRFGFNLRPSLQYDRGPMAEPLKSVIRDLDRDGIAITTVDRLFHNTGCFERMQAEVRLLQQQKSTELQQLRRCADDHSAIGTKTFILQLLGDRPALDPDSIYAQFALQSEMLKIADGYFRMSTRLRYYNVWHTLVTASTARESQLWHRDREDLCILKIFVYLSDVDEGAGPFTYARSTHIKGRWSKQEPEYSLEGVVRRSDDEQMARVVPRADWVAATGRIGTIIFADTHGYHKGGLARERDRLMYTCMFTSPSCGARGLLQRPSSLRLPADRGQAVALSLE